MSECQQQGPQVFTQLFSQQLLPPPMPLPQPQNHRSTKMIRMIQIQQELPFVEQNMFLFLSPRCKSTAPAARGLLQAGG